MALSLLLENISKSFTHGTEVTKAVETLTLSIRQNEFFTLLGPSGCGKTTLLRLIAGLESADSGRILLQGQDITLLPAYRRPVNTVFQSYALFPHMTAAENVGFGLKMKKQDKAATASAVKDALKLVHMEDMASRKPAQLSGGQQQRVALARALVNRPQVLLLDESLSALDYKLRKEMQVELKRLQRETGITFIFVTHDQDEALSMSDRIAVMDKGAVIQCDTPQDLYNNPATRFVADFIGHCNFVPPAALGLGAGPDVGFRPEDAVFLAADHPAPRSMRGKIIQINYRGAVTQYIVQLDDGGLVTVSTAAPLTFREGEPVRVSVPAERLVRCAR